MQGVSVKSVVQKGLGDDARLEMVVHPVLESSFLAAVDLIGRLDFLRAPPRDDPRDRGAVRLTALALPRPAAGRAAGDAGRGRHAARPRARALAPHGRGRLAEVRGREPDRVVQGPRHDRGGVGRDRGGRRGRGVRVHRQHGRERRGLRGAGRAARRGDRARGQDRHRQARPGADARRARGGAARQLRRGAEARARAGRAQPDRARELGERVPDRGAEDRGVRGLRPARRAARRALHPGRERGQHHRLVEGLRGVRRGAAAARLPGRGRRAARARRAGREPGDGRVGDPDRQSRRAGRRRWTRSPPRAARSVRCPTTRSSPRTSCSASARACSASRRRRRRWRGC